MARRNDHFTRRRVLNRVARGLVTLAIIVALILVILMHPAPVHAASLAPSPAFAERSF